MRCRAATRIVRLDDAAPADVARMPWFLSGGLDPGNVAGPSRMPARRRVDVSSGVEAPAGPKDPARIAAFFTAARSGAGTRARLVR